MTVAALKAPGKNRGGRPKGSGAGPRKITLSLRISLDQLAEMDAWIRVNGEIERSAVLRLALANFLRDAKAVASNAEGAGETR